MKIRSMFKPVSIKKKDELSTEKKDDLRTQVISSGLSMKTQKPVKQELTVRESILPHSTSTSCDLSRDQPDLAQISETSTYQQFSEKDTRPNDHNAINHQ